MSAFEKPCSRERGGSQEALEHQLYGGGLTRRSDDDRPAQPRAGALASP
jgi:hypothetical protein